jgi:hypothetical protein
MTWGKGNGEGSEDLNVMWVWTPSTEPFLWCYTQLFKLSFVQRSGFSVDPSLRKTQEIEKRRWMRMKPKSRKWRRRSRTETKIKDLQLLDSSRIRRVCWKKIDFVGVDFGQRLKPKRDKEDNKSEANSGQHARRHKDATPYIHLNSSVRIVQSVGHQDESYSISFTFQLSWIRKLERKLQSCVGKSKGTDDRSESKACELGKNRKWPTKTNKWANKPRAKSV